MSRCLMVSPKNALQTYVGKQKSNFGLQGGDTVQKGIL